MAVEVVDDHERIESRNAAIVINIVRVVVIMEWRIVRKHFDDERCQKCLRTRIAVRVLDRGDGQLDFGLRRSLDKLIVNQFQRAASDLESRIVNGQGQPTRSDAERLSSVTPPTTSPGIKFHHCVVGQSDTLAAARARSLTSMVIAWVNVPPPGTSVAVTLTTIESSDSKSTATPSF